MIRNYGSNQKYVNQNQGYNSRLDEFQAAFFITKLKKLNFINSRRRDIASKYIDELGEIESIQIPRTFKDRLHVFHLFVI